MQNKQTSKRDSVQATAKVALASQAPASPLLHSHTKPLSKSNIAPPLESFESKLTNQMAITLDAHTAGSNSSALPPGVDSLKDTESHMQAEIQTPSQPQTDATESLEHLQESKQSQRDGAVHHMTSLAPPPSQDQDTKTPATPPAALPQSDHGPSESTPLFGSLKSAAKAATASRIASNLARFNNQFKVIKHPHYYIPNIFEKTRVIMRYKSWTSFCIASQGYERGILPTRRTKPPLLKRRYSIDANTTRDWGTNLATDWKGENIEHELCKLGGFHLDLLPKLSHWFPPPHPGRYAAFGAAFQMNPPFDNDVYLQLGGITIHNDAFHSIKCTSWDHGGDPWMRDEILDMALEALRLDLDCDNHAIGIANSIVSQVCLFAALSEDSCPQEYVEYEARFQDKRWIFIVVNDAIGGSQSEILQGNHWSLLALSRVQKSIYYFDSISRGNSSSQEQGMQIARGMLKILGEDAHDWSFRPQKHTPNQFRDNQFDSDVGACGPFVFKMTEILIGHIEHQQSIGAENTCVLELGEDFSLQFKDHFHSLRVRWDIQKRIAHQKAILVAPLTVNNHDQDAIHGTGVELDYSSIVQFAIPRQLEAPIQNKPSTYPVPIDDENYIVYGDGSDGGDRTRSCSRENTALIELYSDPEELYADAEYHDQDGDGGIDLFDY